MHLEQDLVDDWEMQDSWPLTWASDKACEGYTRCHVRPGGEVVQQRIDEVYVSLRWVGAMSQVQVVQVRVSDHQAVMAAFTPEYLQLPPRKRIPIWMLEDKELMEACAQEIRQKMLPFPDSEAGHTRSDPSGIMQWDEHANRAADLMAVRDIQPLDEERQIYDWWDQLDAMAWALVEKAAKGRPAPKEVQYLRWLNKAMNESSTASVSNASWKLQVSTRVYAGGHE